MIVIISSDRAGSPMSRISDPADPRSTAVLIGSAAAPAFDRSASMKHRHGRFAAALVSCTVLIAVALSPLGAGAAWAGLLDTAAVSRESGKQESSLRVDRREATSFTGTEQALAEQIQSSQWLRRALVPASAVAPGTASPLAEPARLIATQDAFLSDPDMSMRERVLAALERDDMQAQLEAYGISLDEARARVDALTDSEIAALSGSLDQEPAGAGNGSNPSLIEYLARTIAAVLFLPFEIIFSIFGVPHQSPLDPEGA